MGRLLIAAVLFGACESESDFPSRPEPIAWHAMELVTRENTVDGTGYKITVPAGAQLREVGVDDLYEQGDLTVTISVYPDQLPLELVAADDVFEGARLASKDVRDDGYTFTYDDGAGVVHFVHVDDGMLGCKARGVATGERAARLLAICKSMRATTPLANPAHYEKGLSPKEVRDGMCNIAMQHVQMMEDQENPPTKKRRSKKELAADKARAAEREEAWDERGARCRKYWWSPDVIKCIVNTTTSADAAACVKTW